MPMQRGCRHYQSRTYASGEVARFCVLDMAADAPWRLPGELPGSIEQAPGGCRRGLTGKLTEPAFELERDRRARRRRR